MKKDIWPCQYRDTTLYFIKNQMTSSSKKPTKDQVIQALAIADAADVEDGAYWAIVHDTLDLDYGDAFSLLEEYDLFDDPSPEVGQDD